MKNIQVKTVIGNDKEVNEWLSENKDKEILSLTSKEVTEYFDDGRYYGVYTHTTIIYENKEM